MNAELDTYTRYLLDRIAAIPAALAGLSTAWRAAHSPPPVLRQSSSPAPAAPPIIRPRRPSRTSPPRKPRSTSRLRPPPPPNSFPASTKRWLFAP